MQRKGMDGEIDRDEIEKMEKQNWRKEGKGEWIGKMEREVDLKQK